MRLDDYRLADCSRFRVPPVDLSAITARLEECIVAAWQRGYDASGAINAVLSDESIVKGLAADLSDNLRFQRGVSLLEAERTKAETVAEYEADLNGQIQTIDSTLGAEAAAREEQTRQRQAEEERRRQSYNATQAQLERMRARVRERLAQVGGQKKLETLLTINDQLIQAQPATPPAYTPSEAAYTPPAETAAAQAPPAPEPAKIERAIAIALTEETIDPLNNPEQTPDTLPPLPPRPGMIRRMWRFINTPLW